MWAIDSSSAKRLIGIGWLIFTATNMGLMFVLPGREAVPYHLIWVSFVLVYGLARWSRWVTWSAFVVITVVTGIALIKYAELKVIRWEECSEIVLMGLIVAVLIWHVDRQRLAQDKLLQQTEAEALRARKREMTARFGSHEVRTRLTIARGFVEMIKGNSSDTAIQADAELVLGELDKASATATKLLTLVRVEGPSPREPMHLDDLIHVLIRRWEATTERQWSAHSSVGIMFGDPERVEAALDCLIENAVKFTSTPDSIDITARREHEQVVIEVRDTGSGIPESDLQRVLDAFQTGRDAGSRAGSGLGLAIVRAIADARRGNVTVASTVGQGTCVTVTFPTTFGQQPAGPSPRKSSEHLDDPDDEPRTLALPRRTD
jgi:two-component system OmpR family sensor kinase